MRSICVADPVVSAAPQLAQVEIVECLDAVLRDLAPVVVDQDDSAIEAPGLHAALHRLHQGNVFGKGRPGVLLDQVKN